MGNDLFYRVALTLIPQIGPVQARLLLEKYGEAKNVFHIPKATLERTEGIGTVRAASILGFRDFARVEKELRFIEKHQIRPLFLTDAQYPRRLLNCYDPPTMLYYKGNADLNTSKIISVIGTRANSDYGKYLTEKLISNLAGSGILIVSGLAFGIDAIAHKSALKHGLNTAGVLAHGLDTIYPPQHTSIAKHMIDQGGLLTEYTSRNQPDRYNFPARNRIVAGISDATVIIETGIKGGSMITAELANNYNREVFAYPGRLTDAKSAGCHHLIVTNKAALLTETKQIFAALGWEEHLDVSRPSSQKSPELLFADLTEDEKKIVELLKFKNILHIDQIGVKTGLAAGAVSAAILNLELLDIVASLPGKAYRLA